MPCLFLMMKRFTRTTQKAWFFRRILNELMRNLYKLRESFKDRAIGSDKKRLRACSMSLDSLEFSIGKAVFYIYICGIK